MLSPVNVVQAIAAAYVLGIGLLALNRMSPNTSHTIRAAYIMLTSGALAALASTLRSVSLFECALAVGVAVYLAADRRKFRKDEP